MKPNPLLSLNHLTVPVVRILVLPFGVAVFGARDERTYRSQMWLVIPALTTGSVPSDFPGRSRRRRCETPPWSPKCSEHNRALTGTGVDGAQGNANRRNAQRRR